MELNVNSETVLKERDILKVKPNWRKDIQSIGLLLILYILQGVPLGLIVTVPFLLQAKEIPYKDQAKFSLANWPFSLKVLYAPVIDAIYWKR
jgi:PAT family acetyl-CoA transporter-like MFS transporter 1